MRRVVRRWQARHHTSGAVWDGPPGEMLIGGDTGVAAVEDLMRLLDVSEVEMIWRA